MKKEQNLKHKEMMNELNYIITLLTHWDLGNFTHKMYVFL